MAKTLVYLVLEYSEDEGQQKMILVPKSEFEEHEQVWNIFKNRDFIGSNTDIYPEYESLRKAGLWQRLAIHPTHWKNDPQRQIVATKVVMTWQ